jgi:hypothetical protein
MMVRYIKPLGRQLGGGCLKGGDCVSTKGVTKSSRLDAKLTSRVIPEQAVRMQIAAEVTKHSGKPELIVWMSEGNFSRGDVERMSAYGVRPFWHLGNRYDYATLGAGNTAMVSLVSRLSAYSLAAGVVPIYCSKIFPSYAHAWNVRENLADATTWAKFLDGATKPTVNGEFSIDCEPPAASPFYGLIGGTTDLEAGEYAALAALSGASAGAFDYSLPSYPRTLHLYNALRGMGNTQISESTYFETWTPSVLNSGIAAGTVSGDIYGLLVSWNGLGYSGHAKKFSDAMARLPGFSRYFIYPTGGNFGEIAAQIIEWCKN